MSNDRPTTGGSRTSHGAWIIIGLAACLVLLTLYLAFPVPLAWLCQKCGMQGPGSGHALFAPQTYIYTNWPLYERWVTWQESWFG